MIGTISVEGLEIECIIGIHPEERDKPQVLLVDVELDRDFAAAAEGDDMAHTVDYVDIAGALTTLAVEGRYRLLETLAEESAKLVMSRFGGERVAIKILKPAAIPEASWAAVRIERR
ncbi:MAG: dihydroneopterin aldolase [Planctomycetes bacterium]|nr:dihydroneopterin aldolase [Planctomycetota bacterium]